MAGATITGPPKSQRAAQVQDNRNLAVGATEHRVVICPEPFGIGFDVTLEPPIPGERLDRGFATRREARSYPGGLRLVHSLQLVDETEEAGR